MVCLAEKIDDGVRWRRRGDLCRRAGALRQRKAPNAPFALHGNGVPAGTTKYLYYSNNWQVIESRWNGTAATNMAHQYVWSQMYIDALVLRDTYSGGAIQANAHIYTQFDANYNVTALIGYNASTNTWGVVQRYVYTPYGVATVLDANWNATTDQFAWQYMHQGGRQDPITSLYLFRHRDYSPALGNWIEQDPAGYIDGSSRYQAGNDSPASTTDLSGDVTNWNQTTDGHISTWPRYDNFGHGRGPMHHNKEYLTVHVCCPKFLASAEEQAFTELTDFRAFNKGNLASVRLVMHHGGIYAAFTPNWHDAIASDIAGNDYSMWVRLLFPHGHHFVEAVTLDNHSLVGIRRWYVKTLSKTSFQIETEAYERGDGSINAWARSPVTSTAVEDTMAIWNTYLTNIVARIHRLMPGEGIRQAGPPRDVWTEQTGRVDPWKASLPANLRARHSVNRVIPLPPPPL